MLLDPFKGEGFTLNSLTAAINNILYTPTVIAESGLFQSAQAFQRSTFRLNQTVKRLD
jgi:hypothetical protein